MEEKLNKILLKLCDLFEIVISVLVCLGIIATLITYVIPALLPLFQQETGAEHFLVYLEDIFSIVVGLEFMKMLCKPSADNVIEVLVFLVARHMILETDGTIDIFLSVVSISILIIVRQALHMLSNKKTIIDVQKEQEK